MKRIILSIMSLILILFAIGCKNNGTTTNNNTSTQITQAKYDDYGREYVDLFKEVSFNEYEYVGLNSYIDKTKYREYESSVNTSRDFKDVIGVVHAAGQYNFTNQSYLTEGANIISKDLGSRVIKLFMNSEIADQYSFNSNWDTYNNLKELASEEEFKKIFNMDFKTIVIACYEFERANLQKTTAISENELNKVSKEFYDLTEYLIKTYNDTGKTFVLQNWEGDNELTPTLKKLSTQEEKDRVVDNYIKYNNARQKGISDAMNALIDNVNYGNIEVLGALELNYISYNGGGEKKLIDYVVPYSKADIFSFSDWSTSTSSLSDDLDRYLNQINLYREEIDKKSMNDIVLGEFGKKERGSDEETQARITFETLKIAIEKGVRYVCYWQLFCNERVGGESNRPVNEDMNGFWLFKPNGEITKTFWMLKSMFEGIDYVELIPNLIMRLPEPEPDPIPFVEEDVLFFDNFDDRGLDGVDIARNRKMEAYSEGMNYDYIKEKDRPLINRYFSKYNISEAVGYYVVQKKPNTPSTEYIQYKVVRENESKDAKFIMRGFIYDPMPKSMIRVEASKDGQTFEPLKSVYLIDKTGEYGYLYITTVVPVGYVSVRVLFTNTKAANSWDPLIAYVAFLK